MQIKISKYEGHRLLLPVFITACIFSACSPSISRFNEQAYQQAVSLKIESLALTDKADEPYENHRSEIEDLQLNLQKAYEYAKGRPDNAITVRQWEILLDPERNSLGGLLARWEENNQLSGVFVQEAKGLISDGFDAIIGLESGKVKPSSME